MGWLSLLEVSTMPVLQVLLISVLGAFMATDYLNLLPTHARNSLNKIVFVAFTPSLVFSNLAETVRLQDLISWWFMPVNIGITFLVGGSLGWLVVKILRPQPHIEELIIAVCATGNLGNILLIIVPAICKEDGNPFGDKSVCSKVGISYVSLSMALGSLYIWTYTYHLIRTAGVKYQAMLTAEAKDFDTSKEAANEDLEADQRVPLLGNTPPDIQTKSNWKHIMEFMHQIGEELKAPALIAAFLGFIFGAVTFLRNIIIGASAPLRVIDDSIKLLGDGTIPCITLILGGNLTQGIRKSRLSSALVIAVICVRYIIMPAVGIGVVKAAAHLGFLPSDPLYHFVLMIQFTVPPAMNIGTMTQLFDVAQEECAVLLLWTYLVAAFALAGWSTVFMWLLSS